jgi:hypothetical protein
VGKNVYRKGRKRQILKWLQAKHREEGESRSTMYEIAHGIGMRPSGHVTSILADLVNEGLLSFEIVPHRAGWEKRVFYLAEVSLPMDITPGFEEVSRNRFVRKERAVSMADLPPTRYSR